MSFNERLPHVHHMPMKKDGWLPADKEKITRGWTTATTSTSTST